MVSYFPTGFLVKASWIKFEVARVLWITRRSWWKHSRMPIGLETNQPQQGDDIQVGHFMVPRPKEHSSQQIESEYLSAVRSFLMCLIGLVEYDKASKGYVPAGEGEFNI